MKAINSVIVRKLKIGAGIPKICIANIGKTKEEIISLTKQYTTMHMDLMEWRADWFESVAEPKEVLEVLNVLRDILVDIPLLFTFRTKKEGGNSSISIEAYKELNLAAARSGNADMIDVEIFTGDMVTSIINGIHEAGIKVIASNHDFDKTPEKADLIYRLRRMEDMGADILKIAVMPQNNKDVLTLLEATQDMRSQYTDKPIITMSMGDIGGISRLSGEVFGSAVTFGAGEACSAPGQIPADELYQVLQIIHQMLG